MSEHCPQPQAHPARCGCEEVENHLERQVDIERINYSAARERLATAEQNAAYWKEQYQALRNDYQRTLVDKNAEAEALRAENGRFAESLRVAHHNLSVGFDTEASLTNQLEAARGLLERVTRNIPQLYGHPALLIEIGDFLTATPAPEVRPDLIRFDFINADGQQDSKMITHDDMRERYAALADQGERQEAVPEETPHIIVFDDADRPNEMLSGAGARPAALRRWEQISVSWNAHLFVRVEKNSRDDPNPCARLATIPQPGPDVRALAAFALELIDGAWKGGSFDGGDIQDAGVRHGLLVVEQREESCGEHCDCAEYGFPAECYRLTPALAAHRQA